MRSHEGYAIRIQNYRTFGIFQYCLHHSERSIRHSQPGSDQHRIHTLQPMYNLRDRIPAELSIRIRQGKHHRLIQLHRFNGIDILRHTQKHQSRTTAESTHGS